MRVIAPSAAAAEVPETIAARGETLVATMHATGAQIYECKTNSDGELAWQFREPIATLVIDGKTVGHHFAGPVWVMADGSAVSAKVSAQAPGATTNDIPLLRLDVAALHGSGLLSEITTIQRLNTHGGRADAACDAPGTFLSVPYSADYAFLQEGCRRHAVSLTASVIQSEDAMQIQVTNIHRRSNGTVDTDVYRRKAFLLRRRDHK